MIQQLTSEVNKSKRQFFNLLPSLLTGNAETHSQVISYNGTFKGGSLRQIRG
jgi:hypothetical protein